MFGRAAFRSPAGLRQGGRDIETTVAKKNSSRLAIVVTAALCALALALGSAWAAGGSASTDSEDGDSGGSLATLAATDDDGAEEATTSEWIELTDELVAENEGELPAGKYYLADDVTLSTCNVSFTGDVTLDLWGHTLKDSDASDSVITISDSASLTLVDSGTEGSGTIDANGSGRGVCVDGGSFTMEGGAITDGSASNGGGVYVDSSGTFAMNGGLISGNTASSYGGGVYVAEGSTFTMTDGAIDDNTSKLQGGGVCVTGSSFAMSGGTVSGNAAGDGDGLLIRSSTFTMAGGIISDNVSKGYGAGVEVASSSSFTMFGGTISGNSASSYGAGVTVTSGSLSISDSSVVITDNVAGSYADDIYLPSSATRSITAIAGTWYTDGSFARYDDQEDPTEVEMTALSSGTAYSLHSEVEGCTVTYAANSDDAAGSSFTQYVANSSTLADDTVFYREGYHISGWNTAADGSGTSYATGGEAAAIAEAGSDVTLYAQWSADAQTVTFTDGVGGLAFDDCAVDASYGDAMPSYAPEWEGFELQGWSATVDGASYYEVPSAVEGEVVLTATWTRTVPEFEAQSVVYDGEVQGFDLGNEAGLDEDSFEVAYYEDEGCTEEVESPVDAGIYYVKISREADGSYAAFEQTTTLAVEKATPTVEVSGVTASYDGEAHAAGATVAGVDGQAADALDGVSVTVSYADGDGEAVVGEDGSASAPVDVGTYTATATYAGSDNYEAATATATVVVVEASDTPFVVESDNGVYDGESHGIVVTSSSEDATVTYSTDGVSYGSDCPGFTEVGVHTVYFRIEEPGCADVEGSTTVTIE